MANQEETKGRKNEDQGQWLVCALGVRRKLKLHPLKRKCESRWCLEKKK
jgi:hypothetical protein